MTSPELYEGLGYDLGIIVSDVLRGVPDPQAKNQRECPRCHGKLIHVEANDSLIIRDAFGMHGFSGRNLNGLPTRGFARTVGLDEKVSATEVERLGSRQSKIQRSVHPTGPSSRDSKGNRKRHEEITGRCAQNVKSRSLHGPRFQEKLIRELELDLLCAPISRAVTATLVEYNRVHGTVYDFVGSGEDARGVDAIASSQRPGESALRFQVTFVDTEGRLRASIAKGESYSAEGSEQDLLDRFADSLR